MLSFNFIISLIFTIIDAMIFISLLSIFRKREDHHRFIDLIAIIIIFIMTYFLTLLGIPPYIKIIPVSITLFLITFLYKIEFYERILLIVLYYFIIIMSELLTTLVISSILGIDLANIELTYKYSLLFLGVISKFLTIIIVSIVKRKFKEKRVILPNVLNYILISVLLLSTMSMILLFYVTLSFHSEKMQLILLLICLFILFIGIGVLTIYLFANKFYINLQNETTKSIYNKSYEKFIINAEKREDSLSKIWHDMNNHIKLLEKIANSENNNSKYLNALKDKFKSIANKINSGNRLIDTILNDKYLEAISHNITFDIKAIAPPELNIDDLDLSSILFNTIDNSIEACLNNSVENKYIYLELYPDGSFLHYKIKNNYNNNINNRSNKKVFLNEKDYISEGYGLRIIKDIVEKYDGYIDIDKGNNEYSVTIVLHLNTKDFIKY